MALEELDCDIQESFLAGYCWADPPEDEREDLAVLLARQPNQRAFHHGLQLADVSRGCVSAASLEELADWSQALEDTIQHTNATYGPTATVDGERNLRLILTSTRWQASRRLAAVPPARSSQSVDPDRIHSGRPRSA